MTSWLAIRALVVHWNTNPSNFSKCTFTKAYPIWLHLFIWSVETDLYWCLLLIHRIEFKVENTREAWVTWSKSQQSGAYWFPLAVYLHLDTTVAISGAYLTFSPTDVELFPHATNVIKWVWTRDILLSYLNPDHQIWYYKLNWAKGFLWKSDRQSCWILTWPGASWSPSERGCRKSWLQSWKFLHSSE